MALILSCVLQFAWIFNVMPASYSGPCWKQMTPNSFDEYALAFYIQLTTWRMVLNFLSILLEIPVP